jgi:hypothetical protein
MCAGMMGLYLVVGKQLRFALNLRQAIEMDVLTRDISLLNTEYKTYVQISSAIDIGTRFSQD